MNGSSRNIFDSQFVFQEHGTWKAVDITTCDVVDKVFVCDDTMIAHQDQCFYPDESALCVFQVHNEESEVFVTTGANCVCVRTHCRELLINNHTVLMSPAINRCFCNVISITGCKSVYIIPQWCTFRHNLSVA